MQTPIAEVEVANLTKRAENDLSDRCSAEFIASSLAKKKSTCCICVASAQP